MVRNIIRDIIDINSEYFRY